MLSDTRKREEYDQFGPSKEGRSAGATADRQHAWQYHSQRSAEQLFRDLFGDFDPFKSYANGRSGFAESAYGYDAAQQVAMNITFEEAVRGASKKLELNVIDACAKCTGTGVEPGYKKVSCPYCNGTGVLSQYRDGFFMQTSCNRCGGQGSFNKASVQWCKGVMRERCY